MGSKAICEHIVFTRLCYEDFSERPLEKEVARQADCSTVTTIGCFGYISK